MIILSLLAEAILWIFLALIEIPIIWIGECALFLVTLGRYKPQWDTHLASGGDFVFLTETRFWAGLVAICVIGGGIKLIFFS